MMTPAELKLKNAIRYYRPSSSAVKVKELAMGQKRGHDHANY